MAKTPKKTKAAEVEAVEEVKTKAVEVEAVEAEELPVKLPAKWSATFMTGALARQPFTYQDGAPHIRAGVNQSPVAVNQTTSTILNPQGDNAQVKISIQGVGDSIISLPRANALGLVASMNRARAANPAAKSGGFISNSLGAVKRTVARKTGGCKSCGG